jgi:hypothetical protein
MDVIALVFVIGGASGYTYAYIGMQRLAGRNGAKPAKEWLLPHFDRYWKASRLALVVAGIGIAIGVGSAIARLVRHRKARA